MRASAGTRGLAYTVRDQGPASTERRPFERSSDRPGSELRNVTDREQPDDDSAEPEGGVSLVRAAKIAFLVFGLLLGALAVAALLTEGAPHAPFEYGVGD